MKKSILLLTVLVFCTGIFLWGCNTPSQKVEENNLVVEAKNELNEAKQEYLEDIHNFRRITLRKIDTNSQSISALNMNIKNEKKEVNSNYERTISDLKERNSEMKQKIESYTAEGEEKWWEFKTQFDREMGELVREFKELTEKKSDN